MSTASATNAPSTPSTPQATASQPAGADRLAMKPAHQMALELTNLERDSPGVLAPVQRQRLAAAIAAAIDARDAEWQARFQPGQAIIAAAIAILDTLRADLQLNEGESITAAVKVIRADNARLQKLAGELGASQTRADMQADNERLAKQVEAGAKIIAEAKGEVFKLKLELGEAQQARDELGKFRDWMLNMLEKSMAGFKRSEDGRSPITELMGQVHVLVYGHNAKEKYVECNARVHKENQQLAAKLTALRQRIEQVGGPFADVCEGREHLPNIACLSTLSDSAMLGHCRAMRDLLKEVRGGDDSDGKAQLEARLQSQGIDTKAFLKQAHEIIDEAKAQYNVPLNKALAEADRAREHVSAMTPEARAELLAKAKVNVHGAPETAQQSADSWQAVAASDPDWVETGKAPYCEVSSMVNRFTLALANRDDEDSLALTNLQAHIREKLGHLQPTAHSAPELVDCAQVSLLAQTALLRRVLEALGPVRDERARELAIRLVAAGPKAAHVSCSETHEISDYIRCTIETAAALCPEIETALGDNKATPCK